MEGSVLVLVEFRVGLHSGRSRANESHLLWQVAEWMMRSDSSNSWCIVPVLKSIYLQLISESDHLSYLFHLLKGLCQH